MESNKPKPGRPSTGRSERIAAFITPEQLEYLKYMKKVDGSYGHSIGELIDRRLALIARGRRLAEEAMEELRMPKAER